MTKPRGFSEAAAPMAAPAVSAQAILGHDGRLLIPAAIRDAAGLERGERVYMQVEDGRLVVESFRATIKRIQDMLAYRKVPGESVVDEFLAERRAESMRESEE
jgi:bifunctional DNA-binding transcriptional regulator/antitoxin component of YhaV-PrlF toxin-antitoxin module